MVHTDEKLARQAASDAVTGLGWRHVLGTLMTSVPVPSLVNAAEAGAAAIAACGSDADGHLRLDLRGDAVQLVLRSTAAQAITRLDVLLAEQISAALADRGLRTVPGVARRVQMLEIALDALDIWAIRPFWKAVMAYVDEGPPPNDGLMDPSGQGPTIWFQEMTEPRPQRNRIHFDVSVPHDEALDRIRATTDAGGVVVYDAEAPAFWVLADPEGNEACVTTWQGRD
ncbi:MAG TPA: VOC family protein [Pseudonocardiaceae bacterium]|nr:VOC family protein [Pseudonocardiaceae bacterium]